MIINCIFIFHILIIIFVITGPFVLPKDMLLIWFFTIFLMASQFIVFKKCCVTQLEKMYVNEDTLFNDDEFVTQNLKRIHIDIHHDITDIVCFIIMYGLILYAFNRIDMYNYGVCIILLIVIVNMIIYEQMTPIL